MDKAHKSMDGVKNHIDSRTNAMILSPIYRAAPENMPHNVSLRKIYQRLMYRLSDDSSIEKLHFLRPHNTTFRH